MPLLLLSRKSDDGVLGCQPVAAIQLIRTLVHSHDYGPSYKNNIDIYYCTSHYKIYDTYKVITTSGRFQVHLLI